MSDADLNPSDRTDLDPAEALGLIETEGLRVHQALDQRIPVQLLAWGIAWLVGFGVMWLDVRGQQPYEAPGPVSGLLFFVLLLAAGTVTGTTVSRAMKGVGGRADRIGTRVGIIWGVGWATFMCLGGALIQAGAPAPVRGVFFTAAAQLVVGLMYAMSGAVWDDPVQWWLGLWLTILAAFSGFLGPVGILPAAAILGGGSFLVAAWIARRRQRVTHGD